MALKPVPLTPEEFGEIEEAAKAMTDDDLAVVSDAIFKMQVIVEDERARRAAQKDINAAGF